MTLCICCMEVNVPRFYFPGYNLESKSKLRNIPTYSYEHSKVQSYHGCSHEKAPQHPHFILKTSPRYNLELFCLKFSSYTKDQSKVYLRLVQGQKLFLCSESLHMKFFHLKIFQDFLTLPCSCFPLPGCLVYTAVICAYQLCGQTSCG